MKILLFVLVISIFPYLAGEAYSQKPIQGTLLYKPAENAPANGNPLYMVSVVLPVPGNGVPVQIKAVISSKDPEQKTERFIFIEHRQGRKGENTFSVEGSDIVAEIGIIDPEKEAVSVYLVYPATQKTSSDGPGKARRQQQKVELSTPSGK